MINFLLKLIKQLSLWNFTNHFAITEQETFSASPRDTDIGFTGFARSVNRAAKHRNLDWHFKVGNIILYFISNREEIDIQSSAGWTRYKGCRIGNETECFQQFPCDLNLLYRVGTKRNTQS
ncbi:hypothetical protein D3C78_1329290 [compost metagenome]